MQQELRQAAGTWAGIGNLGRQQELRLAAGQMCTRHISRLGRIQGEVGKTSVRTHRQAGRTSTHMYSCM
jgi:hypothetical protein